MHAQMRGRSLTGVFRETCCHGACHGDDYKTGGDDSSRRYFLRQPVTMNPNRMSSPPSIVTAVSRTGPWESRYSMIDAFRGLAAFGVVCHHLYIGSSFNLGHICVMVFFVISGYCIAATSESCVRNGVGFGGFMWRRLRRIYPPYFFAVLFFLATRYLKQAVGAGNQISSSVMEWMQNLTLTQWTHLPFDPKSFSAENTHLFVSAFWSLNYEEQFYLLMAVFAALAISFRLPIRRSVAVLAIPCLVWNVIYPSISYGLFVEYWVHFAIGVIVYYRLCRSASRAATLATDLGLSAFAIMSLIGWYVHPTDARWVYKEWAVVSLFGLALILLRRWDGAFRQSLWGRALCAFGLITYSLYLTHQFILRPTRAIADKLVAHGIPHFLTIPIQMVELVLIATVFWYLCERPFLNRPLSRTPRNAPGGPRSSDKIREPNLSPAS
ncbi:MAG TPA: acyltransferase [Candidatus Angelobacter sp.]|nr:acyltransferase [Candidatus Angelobacter sp.]